MIPIVPAIIPTSAADVSLLARALSFSPELHLDVVDGVFVPTISWPYQPAGIAKAVKTETDPFTLEVDLMVANPLPAADAWLEAGADMLVFHVETIPLPAFTRFVESTTISVGISALNDTPFPTLEPYLAVADYVQVMGIAKIGAQSQPFDERVIERIKVVKQAYPQLMVSVDGSVNEATIPQLVAAGADRFICGSAIIKADNKAAAYERLTAVAN